MWFSIKFSPLGCLRINKSEGKFIFSFQEKLLQHGLHDSWVKTKFKFHQLYLLSFHAFSLVCFSHRKYVHWNQKAAWKWTWFLWRQMLLFAALVRIRSMRYYLNWKTSKPCGKRQPYTLLTVTGKTKVLFAQDGYLMCWGSCLIQCFHKVLPASLCCLDCR